MYVEQYQQSMDILDGWEVPRVVETEKGSARNLTLAGRLHLFRCLHEPLKAPSKALLRHAIKHHPELVRAGRCIVNTLKEEFMEPTANPFDWAWEEIAPEDLEVTVGGVQYSLDIRNDLLTGVIFYTPDGDGLRLHVDRNGELVFSTPRKEEPLDTIFPGEPVGVADDGPPEEPTATDTEATDAVVEDVAEPVEDDTVEKE